MKTKLKIFTILAFAVFAGVFLAGDGNGRARTGTAGLKFKNVKVLTEMPADQMGKVMNIMSASLGVNCSFCQVGDDFQKTERKKRKRRAG